MGQQIEITHEQEKVIQLIKTWDEKTVKLALSLDISQNLGIEELYMNFISKYGVVTARFSPPPSGIELCFPIHALLFEYSGSSEIEIPKNIKKGEELLPFLLDYHSLVGLRTEEKKIKLEWDHAYGELGVSIDGSTIGKEIEDLFFKHTDTRINFHINFLPF